MATDQFGSGGGFSNQFNQDNATWQASAVAKYLSTVDQSTLPPAGSFDPKGRATPDVSALGEGYQVVVRDQVEPVGGTSASSPFFASLVSLLNEARLNANKPVMGFLNPFLYKNADAFNDVTAGSNKIGRGGQKLPYGWNCSAGWDPATGLGTPKFDKLLSAAMAAVRTEPTFVAHANLALDTTTPVTMSLIPGLLVDATSHYEDPSPSGCQSGEVKIQIQGVKGDFCSPACTGTSCPTDVPTGVTAKPTCALQDSSTHKKYCALICTPGTLAGDAQCGKNGSCKSIQSVGVCTYND